MAEAKINHWMPTDTKQHAGGTEVRAGSRRVMLDTSTEQRVQSVAQLLEEEGRKAGCTVVLLSRRNALTTLVDGVAYHVRELTIPKRKPDGSWDEAIKVTTVQLDAQMGHIVIVRVEQDAPLLFILPPNVVQKLQRNDEGSARIRMYSRREFTGRPPRLNIWLYLNVWPKRPKD